MLFNWVKEASLLLRTWPTPARLWRGFVLLAVVLSTSTHAQAGPAVLTFAQLVACPINSLAFQGKSAVGATLPENIRSAVGQKVQVTGYMLPLVMEKGRARQLLLMRNTMACCYGQAPAANEYLVVKTPPPGLLVTQDVPVAMQGTLRIEPVMMSGMLVEYFHLDDASLATR